MNKTRGIRQADAASLEAIRKYVRRKVGDCVYMYIDISKYGLDNPNMKVWYDTDQEDISLVVMKYYDSIQVYTEKESFDEESVADLIRENHVAMVSGKAEVIEKIYPRFEEDYKLEVGYVFSLTNFRAFEEVVPIERIEGTEDFREIADLICSDESIGGYYDPENLAGQLKERYLEGFGRNLVIRKNGQIIGHIATYAEYDKIAVTAGLIAKDDGSGIPYGTMLESRLVHDLLDEDFEIYTFVTEKRRAKFFKIMGNKLYGRYGKMTLKQS